jgi:hypothetical protein
VEQFGIIVVASKILLAHHQWHETPRQETRTWSTKLSILSLIILTSGWKWTLTLSMTSWIRGSHFKYFLAFMVRTIAASSVYRRSATIFASTVLVSSGYQSMSEEIPTRMKPRLTVSSCAILGSQNLERWSRNSLFRANLSVSCISKSFRAGFLISNFRFANVRVWSVLRKSLSPV